MKIVNYEELRIIENFLSHEDCDYFINLEGECVPAAVANQGPNKLVRNCKQKIPVSTYDVKVIERMCAKCDEILKGGKFTSEIPSIIRYTKGEFYKTHYDYFGKFKRDYTFLISLNDNYEGGETYFPNLEKEYKLKKGQALFFHNIDKDRNQTFYSLHGGKTIKSGEKWICNLWVHTTEVT